MPLICYEPENCFALADEPEFDDKDTVEKEVPKHAGPVRLEEWRSYYLKWFVDEEPDFVKHLENVKSPFVGRQNWPGKIREINFNNYVGLARLGSLQVHVKNRKISDDQFHALLDNIADHYADLIFGFDEDPVGHGFDRKGPAGRNLAYVEYLFLRRYLLTDEDIEGIVAAILRNPHIRMLRESHSVPLPMARTTDPVALVGSLCRGDHIALLEPGHELCATPLGQALLQRSGKPLFPSEVPEERCYHSYDTHENRFAKHVLQELDRRLDEVCSAVQQHRGGLVNPEPGSDLERLKRKVSGCLDDPFWREVGTLRFLPQGSTVLQRREGYRQLYRLHALLQLLVRYDYGLLDFEYLLETKDTATLYEYWCFFQVKAVLDDHRQRMGTELLVPSSDTQQQLLPGVCLSYEGGLTLCYNLTFRGLQGPGVRLQNPSRASYSQDFKPDIVISHNTRHLVLDAKNKGQRPEFYGTEDDGGGVETSKPEDLVKMHAYRDAIIGAQGAFALFPGNQSELYPVNDTTQPWNGIGALALRPDSSGRPDPDQIRNLKSLILGFIGAD